MAASPPGQVNEESCRPIFMRVSQSIIRGPMRNEMTSAVMQASTARSVSWGRASARVVVMRPRRSSTSALAARSMAFSERARARAPGRSSASGAWGSGAAWAGAACRAGAPWTTAW